MDSIQFYKELLNATKRELIHFRFAAVLIASIVFFGAFVAAMKWPQVYRSSAMIAVNHTNVIEPLLRGAAEVSDAGNNEKVTDIIGSRRLLEKAVQRVADNKGEELSGEQVALRIRLIRNGLTAESGRGNRSITHVNLTSDSQDGAYESLEAIVAVFLEDRVSEKQKDSFEAYSFIDAQANKYKGQLEAAEQRLKSFKAQSADVTEAAVKARIAELTSQIKDLNISIEETQETLKATRQQLTSESQFLAARTKIVALEERKALLTEELDRLRLSYQDGYPDIVSLKSQLRDINISIADKMSLINVDTTGDVSELPLYEELRKQYSSAELRLVTQKRRLRALKQLLVDEKALADEVAGYQAELADLTRDYDVTKNHYEAMLARKENAKLTMALNNEGQGENYKLIQSPVYPLKPEGLNPLLILLIAPLLAILAPIALAFVYVFLDPRMRTETQLAAALPEDVKLLGVVPHQRTPLGKRLARKDMLLIGVWSLILVAFYIYYVVEWVSIP